MLGAEILLSVFTLNTEERWSIVIQMQSFRMMSETKTKKASVTVLSNLSSLIEYTDCLK